MARARSKSRHKHFVLNEALIRRAQKLLGTRTETETIERALEELITERERIRAVWRAHKRFLKSGVQIRDIYGVLEDR